MRILILNWRDIKNPTSGGAEVLTHEMAKRWVSWGHAVTHFSSEFAGSKKTETVDGVKIVRSGEPDIRNLLNSVHFKAFTYYKSNSNSIDMVIDEIHGIPFFTPLYVRGKKIVLICEIAGKIWDINFAFPFNLVGKWMEKLYPIFYRNVKFMTISNSTKKELSEFGVKNIIVLPMGITNPKRLTNLEKEKKPTLIFVARLLKTKGIEDALFACRTLKSEFPDITLWVVGRGEKEYEARLKNMVQKLGLSRHIKFFGFVKQDEKFNLMARAHILVAPSVKEGYGLTIPEAGLVGTPSVAYDVEGYRDIIINGANGLLVSKNIDSLTGGIKKLLTDKKLYSKIQKNSQEESKKLNWDSTAKTALGIIVKS